MKPENLSYSSKTMPAEKQMQAQLAEVDSLREQIAKCQPEIDRLREETDARLSRIAHDMKRLLR